MTREEEEGAKAALREAGWEERDIDTLSAPELKAVGTAILRGKTDLRAEGYTITPLRAGVYEVTTPKRSVTRRDSGRTEDTTGVYTVDVVAGTCTCPFFTAYGLCKHLPALRGEPGFAAAAAAAFAVVVGYDPGSPEGDKTVRVNLDPERDFD